MTEDTSLSSAAEKVTDRKMTETCQPDNKNSCNMHRHNDSQLKIYVHREQWRIAKNGGGYTQTGVAKGLKVHCLFMITEVSIRCQKTP